MKIIAKYIHGSEDSVDVDTYYVCDELPSFAECKGWCDSIKGENANLITVKNGTVDKVYKGTPDEVNNSILDTYCLHGQTCPLIIIKRVERDNVIKAIRAVRGILSHLSRSYARPEIKAALKGTWKIRLETLSNIDFAEVDFDGLNKHMSGYDIKKVIAFQIGQSMGLYDGKELYTKREIAVEYKPLEPFLYREPTANVTELGNLLKLYVKMLTALNFNETVRDGHPCIVTDNAIYDLITERKINNVCI